MDPSYNFALNSAYGWDTGTEPALPFNMNEQSQGVAPKFKMDTSDTMPVVSAETATNRASIANYAVGRELYKNWDDFYGPILGGEERNLRTSDAAGLDKINYDNYRKAVINVGNMPFTNNADLLRATQPPANLNPDSVYETYYANRWMDEFWQSKERGLFNNWGEYSNLTNETMNMGADHGGKWLFAARKEEESKKLVENQGWIPWGVDQAKFLAPVMYKTIKLSGLIDIGDEGKFKGMGEYLEAVRKYMYRMPMDQYTKTFNSVMEKLQEANPTLAHDFATAMKGQSSEEKSLSTLGEALDIVAAGGAIKGLASLGKTLATAKSTVNAVESAVNNMKIAKDTNIPIKVAAPAAVGDLEEAGIQRTTLNATENVHNLTDPGERARQALTSGFRVDMEDYRANPGRWGQEIVNRLDTVYNGLTTIVTDKFGAVMKVNRIPGIINSEEDVRKLQAAIKDNYKGIDNQILDISSPVYEPFSNSYYYRINVGKESGVYFQEERVAANNARMNGFRLAAPELETFKTTAGTYTVTERGGTFKVVKEGELRPESARTVYLSQADYERFTELKKGSRFIDEEGTISVASPKMTKKGTVYDIPDKHKNIPYSNKPTEGLIPLELFTQSPLKGSNYASYKDYLFGGKITELGKTPPTEGFRIKNDGAGYYIEYLLPLNEKQNIVRDGLVKLHQTESGPTPLMTGGKAEYQAAIKQGVSNTDLAPSWFNGYTNGVIGLFRNPEETLSIAENAQRKVATFGPSVLLKDAEKIDKNIQAIPRKYWDDFDRATKYSQQADNKETGKPGRMFKDPGELEEWYIGNIKENGTPRLPTKEEIVGYFTWKGLIEFDRSMRVTAEVRNRSKVGAQTHNIGFLDPNDGKTLLWTSDVDGVLHSKRPHGMEGDTFAIMGKKLGDEVYEKATSTFWISTPGKTLDQNILDGKLKVLEFYDPGRYEFESMFGEGRRVRYVVIEPSKIQTRPISWENQVPRQGGGHLVPDYKWTIKQADMKYDSTGANKETGLGGTWNYEGDIPFAPVANAAMGRAFLKEFNPIAELIQKRKFDEAKRLFDKSNMTKFDFDEMKQWFSWSKGPEGEKIPPRFNSHTTFRVVQANRLIVDVDQQLEKSFENFRDATRAGSLARTAQVEFTQERNMHNLMALNDLGSRGRPVFSLEPAKLMDPLTIMDRSMSRILNTGWFDDIKDMQMEHWLRQAAPYLDIDESMLRSNPLWSFHNYKFKSGVDGPSWEIKSTLMSNHKKINDFIGTSSFIERGVHRASQKLADSLYENVGPKVALVPDAALPYVDSPLQLSRSLAFNLKQGVYSISTIFSQLATHANIFAIAPRHTMGAMGAMAFDQYLKNNMKPQMIAMFDNMASVFNQPFSQWAARGFKEGQFKEAFEGLNNSGFRNVGREHAFQDTQLSTQPIRNKAGQLIQDGQWFFRKGNEMNRATAWYASYLEFRTINPDKVMGRGDWEAVLARASILDTNMSRASSSVLHTGPTSMMSMFLSYSMRLSELMFGKQLTWPEKARMIFVNSALYGVPVGGLGLYAFPMADSVRQWALGSGYVPGEKLFDTVIMEGGPAVLLAMATGEGWDYQKGTFFNVSKWGTKGIEPLGHILSKDKSLWDIFAGAPGSVIANSISNMSNMWKWIIDTVSGNAEGRKLRPSDFTDIFNEIKSYSDVKKALVAWNVGQWRNNRDVVMENDVSGTRAFFQLISGLTPQAYTDAFLMRQQGKAEEQLQKDHINKALQDYRRGFQAYETKDYSGGDVYMANAEKWLIAGGVPQSLWKDVLYQASQSHVPLSERVEFNFYGGKKVPEDKADVRMKAYEMRQQLREKGQR